MPKNVCFGSNAILALAISLFDFVISTAVKRARAIVSARVGRRDLLFLMVEWLPEVADLIIELVIPEMMGLV